MPEEDRSASQPRSKPQPPPPPPSSTPSEIRAFVAEYFLFLGHTSTEAEAQASRLYINGPSLYTLPEEQWRNVYGAAAGHLIFEFLQRSKYGHLSKVVATGPLFGLLSGVLALLETPVQQEISSSTTAEANSLSSQSSSSLLQRDNTSSVSCVRQRKSLNGSTSSQNDNKIRSPAYAER